MALPIKIRHNEVILHAVNSFTKSRHDVIFTTFLNTLDINTFWLNTTSREKLLIQPPRSSTFPISLFGLLLFAAVFLAFGLGRLVRFLAEILTLVNILDDVFQLAREVISFHVGKNGCIILIIGKVKVVGIGHFPHNTTPLALLKHIDVPLTQAIVFRRLLVFWLGEENVVISFQRWASPNVRRGIPFTSHVVKVRCQQLVVDKSTHATGTHVIYTIQVGNIHCTLIWRSICFIVFVYVETKQNDINSIKVLKQNEALAAVLELGGVILPE